MRAASWVRFATVVLLVSGAALALASAGCGGSKKPPKAEDAGPEDAGGGTIEDFDAAVGMPVKNRDSGVVEPGMPAEGLVGKCAIDTNKIFTVTTGDMPFLGSPLAVNLATSMFAVPFVTATEGCLGNNVSVTTLKGANTAPDPEAKVALDDCINIPVAPAIGASGDNWLLATIDDHDTPWDVWVTRYNSGRNELGLRTRVSDSPTQELAVAMRDLRDGGLIVAWVDLDSDGASTLYVRMLTAGGAPRSDAQVIDRWDATKGADPMKNPKLAYSSISLTALGEAGAGIAYWRYDASNHTVSEIVFKALDADAKVTNEFMLTDNAGQFASVDVEVSDALNGGAVVYTQAESTLGLDLWFQRIDDMGKIAKLQSSLGDSPPVRFASAPNRQTDVSVTKLRNQYAVVYRRLPSMSDPKARIRLQFLNEDGGKFGDSDVSYSSETGGRTAIKAAYDGRVVVSWAEVDVRGRGVIKVARLGCVGG